jgi:hypothetical protein
MGFLLQLIDRLKAPDRSCMKFDAGLLCEGGWLALLSCWVGLHFPSLQKPAGNHKGAWRAATDPHECRVSHAKKLNGSECNPGTDQACGHGPCSGFQMPDNKQGSLGVPSRPACCKMRRRADARAHGVTSSSFVLAHNPSITQFRIDETRTADASAARTAVRTGS